MTEQIAPTWDDGPTPFAFTVRTPFPPPGGSPVVADDSAVCPA